MKDYFRQESVAFRNTPWFWATRILLVLVILLSGKSQWYIMCMSQWFSIGILYSTEEEYLLPLTEKEYKHRRMTRVWMIWIRYLILGMLSYAMVYGIQGYLHTNDNIPGRPLMTIVFFILQMVTLYEILLESVVDREEKKAFFRTPTKLIPFAIFFVYGIAYVIAGTTGPFYSGQMMIHIAVMMTAVLIEIFNCIRMIRDWKIGDYDPFDDRIKTWKQA